MNGFCLLENCKLKMRKTYVCDRGSGLIAGGQKTKPREFPHMAGKMETFSL